MRTFGLGLQLGFGNVVTRASSGGGGGGGSDPYIGNVVSLFHFDGANGSVANVDQVGIPWTAWGGPTITTAESKFGGACAYFDGSNDFLYNSTNPPAFTFGSGEFCIELWARFPTTTGFGAFHSKWLDSGSRRSYIFGRSGTTIVFYVSTAGTGTNYPVSSATGVVTTNTWYHIAVSRQNNTSIGFDTFRIFVDGVVVATQDVPAGTAIHNPSAWVMIGDINTGSLDYTGYMDELRVTKGVARYTGAFTPPTAPFPDP